MKIKLNHEQSVAFAKAMSEVRKPTDTLKRSAKEYQQTVKTDIKKEKR